MLYIDPADCIDCEACVPECPVEAIFAEANVPAQWASFTPLNADEVRRAQGRRHRPHHREAGRQGRAGVQEEVSQQSRPLRVSAAVTTRDRVTRRLSPMPCHRHSAHPARHARRPDARRPCGPTSASSSAIRASSKCRRWKWWLDPQPASSSAPPGRSRPPSTAASGTRRPARRCCTGPDARPNCSRRSCPDVPVRFGMQVGNPPLARRRRRDDRRAASIG